MLYSIYLRFSANYMSNAFLRYRNSQVKVTSLRDSSIITILLYLYTLIYY
jgi:hypothetical protein